MSLFTTDDYRQALQALIPTGRAWPRDPDTVQYAVLRSLAASYQRSDSDALSILSGAFQNRNNHATGVGKGSESA
jgi:uncharacterized protein YmfQ (DUF2313 family)